MSHSTSAVNSKIISGVESTHQPVLSLTSYLTHRDLGCAGL